jgi:redox-sensitive bicupin YhaK (pirin superfamily)
MHLEIRTMSFDLEANSPILRIGTVRRKGEIELGAFDGYRRRRHLGELPDPGKPLSSRTTGFGPLRVFDELAIDPGRRLSFERQDGFEAVLYVLEGECLVESDGGGAFEVPRGSAAHITLGGGRRYDVSNRSPTGVLGVLLAAFVAPLAHPRAEFAIRAFDEQAADVAWWATPAAEAPVQGAFAMGSTVWLGIATLDPGVELTFPPAANRGLFTVVLQGNIELQSGFLEEGGDARLSLASRVRMQGVARSRVVVADVPMGFVQTLL